MQSKKRGQDIKIGHFHTGLEELIDVEFAKYNRFRTTKAAKQHRRYANISFGEEKRIVHISISGTDVRMFLT